MPQKVCSVILFIFVVLACNQEKMVNQGGYNPKLHTLEDGDTLLPIKVDGKTGYINQAGEVIIKPVFKNAGPFSEGLAFTRKKGLFGYINKSGKFVLDPIYAYATSFHHNRAKVIHKGKKKVIDSQGREVFSLDTLGVKDIDAFKNNMAKIKTYGEHAGYVNRNGKLIIDTVFEEIRKFNHGVAVAYMDTLLDGKKSSGWGLIDTTGSLLSEFGLYKEIGTFRDSFFKVELKGKDPDFGPKYGYMNLKGNLEFTLPYKKFWMGQPFLDDYAVIDYIYRVDSEAMTITLQDTVVFNKKGEPITQSKEKKYYNKDYKDHAVIINKKGEVIFDSPKFKVIQNLGSGKILAGEEYHDYQLINFKTGEKPLNGTITSFEGTFEDGLLIAGSNNNMGVLNESGKWVISPRYKRLKKINTFKGYYWAEGDSAKYFIVNSKDQTIFSFDSLKNYRIHHPYLYVKTNRYSAYVNPLKKEMVWKHVEKGDFGYRKLDHIYQFRGFFYARSKPEERLPDEERKRYNYPEKVPPRLTDLPGLNLFIDTTEKDTFSGHYQSYKAYLVNNTSDTAVLPVQDNRLYMKMQAKNFEGKWKDIMYLPSSWCGNSYYNISLLPGHCWQFKIPVTAGARKTKVRLRLDQDEFSNTVRRDNLTNDPMDSTVIYSNSFPARINPAQFFIKQPYTPSGIMDPYYPVN